MPSAPVLIKPLQPPWRAGKTGKPGLTVSRLKGRPFYGQAMGQLRLTCTFSAECAQPDGNTPLLPTASPPVGEILVTLHLEMLMKLEAERRANFPLRGKWCRRHQKGCISHGRSPVVWFFCRRCHKHRLPQIHSTHSAPALAGERWWRQPPKGALPEGYRKQMTQ